MPEPVMFSPAEYRALRDMRDRVWQQMAQQDYAGADPFDGLESRFFAQSPFVSSRLARLVWLQAMKHAPQMVRNRAGIAPLLTPKTLALLLGAGSGVPVGNWQTEFAGFDGDVLTRDFTRQLLTLRNEDGGWGYPFAWQARAFYAGRGQSNAIVTCFVVDGLVQGGKLPPDHPALQAAATFLRRELWREQGGATDGGYFAYIAHSDAEIHNVSLWGAWILQMLCPGNALSPVALQRVLDRQQEDGSWAYGTRSHHRFVDGFHTGYILDLLHRFKGTGTSPVDVTLALDRGWRFYRRSCFDDDGIPRSFAGKTGYLDSHAVAQAMATLRRFGDRAGAAHVARFAMRDLFDAKRGVFYAGIGRIGQDRRVFMRWTQAWMVWAFSMMLADAPPDAERM
ncbi:hypothetical protein TH25_14865 [Thalassospira profundimaris]|uniref:Squalene cyclase C-terminal domain-containing protein n=1 Tax=Thalassospira profundimaris TaxID=502049 RepID=A0A367X3V1_9PROT|nr:hypothetical protein [Thalassospira profundimaris]RCK48335.1 hypothetical protein TH25_14865 [Thalassospira profundimaris]